MCFSFSNGYTGIKMIYTTQKNLRLLLLLGATLTLWGCTISGNTEGDKQVQNTAESATESTAESIRVGEMVAAVGYAIKHPQQPDSLAVITAAGTDSRHYVMIRGWLVQELSGVESQQQAHRDAEAKAKFQDKVDFLRLAIRRIDLE